MTMIINQSNNYGRAIEIVMKVNCLLLRRWRKFVLIPTVNHFGDASHLVTKPSSLFEHENFRQIIRLSIEFSTGKGLSGL